LLGKTLHGLTDEQIAKVSHQNAMRHFSYDPFSVLPREQCTVAALRQRAAGHDISIRSTNRSKVGAHATRAMDLRGNVPR
jgi:hypothetical protein